MNRRPYERTKWAIAAAIIASPVLLLLAVMVRFHYGPADALFTLIVGTSTEWAPDFTEARFDQVSIGDSQEDVRRVIGDPLRSWSYTYSEGPLTIWAYAWQRTGSDN